MDREVRLGVRGNRETGETAQTCKQGSLSVSNCLAVYIVSLVSIVSQYPDTGSLTQRPQTTARRGPRPDKFSKRANAQ